MAGAVACDGAVRWSSGFGSADVARGVPATPETKGFVNRERFQAMKPGAVLINTSRGDVVREPALIEALESGTLGGAGLDVFAEEPLPQDSRWRTLDNVTTSPHRAGYTVEAHLRNGDAMVDEVGRWLRGEPLHLLPGGVERLRGQRQQPHPTLGAQRPARHGGLQQRPPDDHQAERDQEHEEGANSQQPGSGVHHIADRLQPALHHPADLQRTSRAEPNHPRRTHRDDGSDTRSAPGQASGAPTARIEKMSTRAPRRKGGLTSGSVAPILRLTGYQIGYGMGYDGGYRMGYDVGYHVGYKMGHPRRCTVCGTACSSIRRVRVFRRAHGRGCHAASVAVW